MKMNSPNCTRKKRNRGVGAKLKLEAFIIMSRSVVNLNKKSVLNPHCLLSWDAIKGKN